MQREVERQAERASPVDLETEAWQVKSYTIKVKRQRELGEEREAQAETAVLAEKKQAKWLKTGSKPRGKPEQMGRAAGGIERPGGWGQAVEPI